MNSPFLVQQDFFAPNLCEQIIDDIQIKEPDRDVEGDPRKLERSVLKWEQVIIEKFRPLIPEIESRYDCVYRGLNQPVFQYFPENPKVPAEPAGCENAKYVRKRWVTCKDVDLVGFIWLKDFNSNIPLDARFEVYGGKMEFPVYDFSLVPQRGTLVLFPAGPHFINTISPIMLGELYQVKLNVSIKTKDESHWLYQPEKFPGNYQTWFEGYF